MAKDQSGVEGGACKGCARAIRGLRYIAETTNDDGIAAMAWKIMDDIILERGFIVFG